MMSKKCKYALKALSCLAKYEGKKLNSVQISEQEQIPRKFLENILLTLKLQGYISSKLGKEGGYFLLKKAQDITLAEIYRLFDGAIALLPCVSERFYQPCEDCENPEECKMKNIFTEFRINTLELMKKRTILDLI